MEISVNIQSLEAVLKKYIVRKDQMGHERIGFLLKTKQWKTIIDQLTDYGTGSDTVAQIADTTLTCIRTLKPAKPSSPKWYNNL